MKTKELCIGLILSFFILLILATSCTTRHEPVPILFDPLRYPAETFYVGVGIAIDKEVIKAKKTATLLAKADLASKIASTVFLRKEASLSDNGIAESLTFQELIQESLLQKLENLSFIEEHYSPKNGQITYAIINKGVWEAQKAKNILKAKEQAQTLLAERYPDMSLAREITILNATLASLGATQWGALVEDKFDGSYGNLMPMVRARRDLLVSRIRISTLYYVSDGLSPSNLISAKELALQQFQNFLLEKLYLEYENHRIMASSAMSTQELKKAINEHIQFCTAQHHNLLEYFEAPTSSDELYHVVLVVSRASWEEEEQNKVEELYQSVYPIFLSYTQEASVTDQIAALKKIQHLLGTSFVGLAIENHLFSQPKANKMGISLLLDQLIKSVQLSINCPSSLEEGQLFSVEVSLTNSLALVTEIPVTIIISDSKGELVFSQLGFMHEGESLAVRPLLPPEKKVQSLHVAIYWADYPQQGVETTIPIRSIPLGTRVWKWFTTRGTS
ncbi:MAG: hypothetical protein RBR15_06890 [Sphaerochaeta sp.]|nr:hypothetical protein [Sphaerochaeta sp.]